MNIFDTVSYLESVPACYYIKIVLVDVTAWVFLMPVMPICSYSLNLVCGRVLAIAYNKIFHCIFNCTYFKAKTMILKIFSKVDLKDFHISLQNKFRLGGDLGK